MPQLGSISLPFTESGHSQAGVRELNAITGFSDDKFVGVKPLKLFKKIIQLWCSPNGLVLDPFAGTSTTGQAVLQLNKETGANRSFILVETGNMENGDNYCRTLLQRRLAAAITGQ
ncbi:MAG: site-specific DNA-methyltransferase [Mollicutes bacterium UO1]